MYWSERARSVCTNSSPSRGGRPRDRKMSTVPRPSAVGIHVLGDVVGHHGVHGEALAGVADRRACDVAEAHRAVALEREDPRVRRGRDNGPQQAERHRPAMLVQQCLEPCRPRPPAESADRHRFVLVGHVDDHRRHARALHLIGVDHAERNARGDRRIDGIAAGLQHSVSGLGREIVARRDHVAGRRDHVLKGHSGLRARYALIPSSASAVPPSIAILSASLNPGVARM